MRLIGWIVTYLGVLFVAAAALAASQGAYFPAAIIAINSVSMFFNGSTLRTNAQTIANLKKIERNADNY
jgi:hypothetical protein